MIGFYLHRILLTQRTLLIQDSTERERFPCTSGARGQGPNTMVKCELRTVNESGHKLIEFLLDKQSGHSDT